MARGRIATRVGGVKPVDVGEQDELIGLHHFGHAGGEAIIVAEANLRRRDRVILVDHGNAAQRQQGVQRGAGVEVAASILGIVGGQQKLRGGQADGGERFAPGLCQADLTDGGGGLLFFELQALAGQPEGAAGEGDSPGRYDDDFCSPRAQGGDVGGDSGQPGGARCGVALVDDQGAADLDDEALGGGDGQGHEDTLIA